MTSSTNDELCPALGRVYLGQIDKVEAHFVIVAADASMPDQSRVPSCVGDPCRRGHMGEKQPDMPFSVFSVQPCITYHLVQRLQRVIRIGRTGHWLNHINEHMLVGVKTNYDSNGNLKFLHGSIATWIWTSSCQKFVRRVANQMKFMGSSSECAPAGARSKYSVESTARGQGGLSPTNRDGDAKILEGG